MIALPEFSEGRDAFVLTALYDAIRAVEGADVLALVADEDFDRAQIGVIGTDAAVVEAVLAGARVALERDVALEAVPFVWRAERERPACEAAASELARRLGEEPALPEPEVCARGLIVQINFHLAPDHTAAEAEEIAAALAGRFDGVSARGGEPRPDVIAIAVRIDRPAEVPTLQVLDAIRERAAVRGASLFGPSPAAALDGFPEGLPVAGASFAAL